MIERIEINGIATFTENVILENLQKINFIYGANGTGKSTISRVLNNINEYPSCKISWQGNTELQILTYNKDFRDKNYVEHMPGIFTLGEATKEAVDEINAKQEDLQQCDERLREFKKSIENYTTDRSAHITSFRESAWHDVFKPHEKYFPKPSIKAGTKDAFMLSLLSAHKEIVDCVKLEELKEKAKLLFASHPEPMQPVLSINDESLKHIEKADIWTKIIVGSDDVDIAGLIKSLGNADWVNQGLQYIQDEDVCPFCQQHTITIDFRNKISSFFNEEYTNSVKQIKESASDYKIFSENLTNRVNEILTDEKNSQKSMLDVEQFEAEFIALRRTIDTNIERIGLKDKEPSRTINLSDTDIIVDRLNALIKTANDKIETHNNIVANFGKEKDELVKAIWNYFANNYKVQIESYNTRLNDLDKAIKSLGQKLDTTQKEHSRLEAEIQSLENNITSIKPTINEINRQLKVLGFTNFSICEVPGHPNYYQIVRENGELAKDTLSEGESTFITFLYFMQLVKGSTSSTGVVQDRILVIDDPVSSLDSNVLFIVSTMLRDIFKEVHRGERVKQVFLLTHNVYFHKEVSYPTKACEWRDIISYYILRKDNNKSSITCYNKKNPIKSSYDLLWAEYMNAQVSSYTTIQNIMRRIIENYFEIFGGYTPDELLSKFDEPEEKQICRSLLSWINDGSHSLTDDLFVETPDIQIKKYKDVFKDIFYKMGHGAHYDMMTRDIEEKDHAIV